MRSRLSSVFVVDVEVMTGKTACTQDTGILAAESYEHASAARRPSLSAVCHVELDAAPKEQNTCGFLEYHILK